MGDIAEIVILVAAMCAYDAVVRAGWHDEAACLGVSLPGFCRRPGVLDRKALPYVTVRDVRLPPLWGQGYRNRALKRYSRRALGRDPQTTTAAWLAISLSFSPKEEGVGGREAGATPTGPSFQTEGGRSVPGARSPVPSFPVGPSPRVPPSSGLKQFY